MLKKWEDIPVEMQIEEVRPYYKSLKKKSASLVLKRVFDIFMALALIIVLSIPMLFVACWIKIDSKGPVFYRQERVTTYGEKFWIYKFRTMDNDADRKGSLVTVSEDCRITKVGQKIRRCRIDEIPQLFNVIRGDMSFVGTRPEVPKYVELYTNEMYATLLLPAGVTSLASLRYKYEDVVLNEMVSNGMTLDCAYVEQVLPDKMKYNLQYLLEFNLIKDFKICIKTIM